MKYQISMVHTGDPMVDHVIGSAKVGSRGQVVLPVDIRKQCGIEPGDTLIVMSRPGPGGMSVVMMKASSMAQFLDHMEGAKDRIRDLISKEKGKVR